MRVQIYLQTHQSSFSIGISSGCNVLCIFVIVTLYTALLLLLKYTLSNNLTMKVSLELVSPVNKCVCESVVCYCLAKE